MLKTYLLTQLLFLLFLNLFSSNVQLGFVVGCHETEREALLKFKHSLVKVNNRLSSWEGRECCHWEGVGCDNVTGYINRLDLHNIPYWDTYDIYESLLITGPKLDPSLLELRHLNYLDLSSNDFQGSTIPGFIGSFEQLRHLNLSYSNFGGVVPSQVGNLTRLHTLDLSMNFFGYLSSDLHWVSSLLSLEYLNMGGTLISHTRNFIHGWNMPPSLLSLRLDYCQLVVPQIRSLFSNSTWLSTIQHLDLSNNALEGPLPRVFANMTSLRHLSLSSAQFNGPIPFSLRSMQKLEHVDLSHNSFSHIEGGEMMAVLGDLCKLQIFDLSNNSIGGSLGSSNNNFSKCVTYDLEILQLGGNMIKGTLPSSLSQFERLRLLDISHNTLNGRIPESILSLLHLEELYLSHNSLNGALPLSFKELSSLQTLELSNNFLNGKFPEDLGQCRTLVFIDLSSNLLEGAISESHLANLSRLSFLDVSFNRLDLNLSSNWSPPFQLTHLRMKSCVVQTPFPRWIGNQTKLTVLDLSDNMITGELNQWFPSVQLREVNISHNRIRGPIPYFSSLKLESIDLSNNLLSGPFLHDTYSYTKNVVAGVPVCQLPSLEYLDLQKNQIVGTIPDCWGYSNDLEYINLSNNNLSGKIPMSMGLIQHLGFLKLSSNSLQGSIPSTFISSSKLQVFDLGENKLVGNIPTGWSETSHPILQMLRLRGNQLVGRIPPTLCFLPMLQFIDLAHNNLIGRIPSCFGDLFSMGSPFSTDDNADIAPGPSYAAGYTNPREDSTTVILKGAELQYSTTLKFVVDLDLSCNALTGSIPEEITNLSALIGLNLSHNHLTGNIPNKIGEMRLLESLDLSNNNLTGTIPLSMSDITSLSSLNLSYNKLHGKIPTGRQLQTLNDPSAYEGNMGLCGNPLPKKCITNQEENQVEQEQGEYSKEDNEEISVFYFVIMSGFATGFWVVVGSLVLKRRFRFALFHLMDRITDYFYVQVMVRINRRRN